MKYAIYNEKTDTPGSVSGHNAFPHPHTLNPLHGKLRSAPDSHRRQYELRIGPPSDLSNGATRLPNGIHTMASCQGPVKVFQVVSFPVQDAAGRTIMT